MKKKFILIIVSLIISINFLNATPSNFSLSAPSHASEDVDVWPLFEWEESTDSISVNYSLYISNDPQFPSGNIVVYDSLNVTSYRPEVDLIMGETIYYWKVKAVNENGEETWADAPGSPFSFWMLQTIPETQPREVMASAPLPFNRTLITENTPYTMRQGNLTIPSGIFLNLQEGITFMIEGDRYLDVHGCIKMLGTESDSIIVTTKNVDPSPGDWKDIRFANEAQDVTIAPNGDYLDGPIFKYVQFKYAGSSNATIQSTNTSIYVENCLFDGSKNSNTGAIYTENGNSVFNYNIIENYNDTGLYATGNNTEICNNTIENCQSSGNGGGIYANGDSLIIEENILDSCSVFKEGNDFTRYGGGMFIEGSEVLITNNFVTGCYIDIYSSGGCCYNHAKAFGGGIYLNINSSNIISNTVDSCYCRAKAHSGDGNDSNPYGGGMFIEGSGNSLKSNIIKNNYLITNGGSDPHRYGAGIFIDSSNNLFTNNTIINNCGDEEIDKGGGIFVNGEYTTIDSCTISGHEAKHGGGIYINKDNVRVDHSTITNNHASNQGGGIHGGRWIYNSIIKYNTVGDTTHAGGLYIDADSVNFNNINHNQGYQLQKGNSTNTAATNNWWFTRSDQVTIEGYIWDGNDTAGDLGFAYYQPFLTDSSPTIPGKFTEVNYIEAKDDSTYTTPLSHPLYQGDTLYFEIGGVDSNPYNREVTVASVVNWTNFNSVRPFFEETGNNTGVFHGKVFLSDQTLLPDSLSVNTGDSLIITSEADPSKNFSLIIGEGSDFGTIEGTVTLDGGTGNVEEVLVETDEYSTNPDTSGYYSFTLSSGTYDITASLDNYETQTIEDVVVNSGQTTSGIDFNLVPDSSIVQTIDLISDWNMLSFYNQPANMDMQAIMQPLIDSGTLVKVQDESGNILQYIDGSWYNSIGDMENTEGYYVKVNTNTSLTIEGSLVELPLTIELSSGWNIMSYPVTSSQNAIDAVQPLIDSGELVKVVDESGNIIQYIDGSWYNSIGNFEPGEGYYIKVNCETQLTLDEPVVSIAENEEPEPKKKVDSRGRSHFVKCWTGNGYNNMTFLINSATIDEEDMVAGDEIGIFDGDLCLGAGVLEATIPPMFQIVCSADDPITTEVDGFIEGNEIILKVWDSSEEQEISNAEATFDPGYDDQFAQLGTALVDLASSYSVGHGHSLSTAIYSNYPNPFTTSTQIEFSLKTVSQVNISIYNLNGQLIKTLINEDLTPANYNVMWDGKDNNGSAVSNGIYFYKMNTENYSNVKKMIYMR